MHVLTRSIAGSVAGKFRVLDKLPVWHSVRLLSVLSRQRVAHLDGAFFNSLQGRVANLQLGAVRLELASEFGIEINSFQPCLDFSGLSSMRSRSAQSLVGRVLRRELRLIIR
jgi:hypothetical protein